MNAIRRQLLPGASEARRGFTLVELMVVIVIIAILSGLTLSALAGARQRSKIDVTRSTIRKLNDIIIPQYESYLRRRVPLPPGLTSASDIARARLARKRCLMAAELPDRWIDVDPTPAPPVVTGPMKAYAAYKRQLNANAAATTWATNSERYEGAECLAMIVMRGGFSEDVMDQFRSDEVGDIDRDGAVEFWDAWGRPIDLIRWPAGFESVIQTRNSAARPDPFDPAGVSDARAYPYSPDQPPNSLPFDQPPTTLPAPALPQRDYAVVPLIFSAGPDEATNDPLGSESGYGIKRGGPAGSWTSVLLATPPVLTTRVGPASVMPPEDMPGRVSDAAAFRDNITNHDLLKQ